MTFELTHNKETNVAYVDVRPLPPQVGTRIDVIDVTDKLGLKTQVLARMDEDQMLLGLIIEDYSAFRREVQIKYLAFAVEKLLELIIAKVKLVTAGNGPHDSHHLPTATAHA